MEELYENYYSGDENTKQDIHKEIDNFDIYTSKDIDLLKKNQEIYSSYPDHYNKNFIEELSKKTEYYHNKSLLDVKDLQNKCIPSNDFNLTNNQQFLKNFINDRTPYNGILVFHGVGVGKTCSAVNISSSFREAYYKKDNKKIICLVSKNIQEGWKNTIYDPDENKKGNQCSGNSFDNYFSSSRKPTKIKVNKLIREYYDFFGYQEFANRVKKIIKKATDKSMNIQEKTRIEKEVISQHFSNRLLIIDEVHNLRDEKDTYIDDSEEQEDISDTKEIVRKVIKYSENMKLVLLSATPLFNKSTEIVWLLNLLLTNDNRPELEIKDIFDNNDGEYVLTKKGEEILQNKSRSYISYLRGENPISFPIRLYPDINKDKKCIRSMNIGKHEEYLKDIDFSTFPKIGFNGETPVKDFKLLKLYKSNFKEKSSQENLYKQFYNTLKDNKLSLSERNIGIQLSNIVFTDDPNEDDYSDYYGQRGFEQIVKGTKSFKYIDPDKPLFSPKYLGDISCKISNTLNSLKKDKAEGIIFIYSDYIYSGVLPIALALEHIGFEKYGGSNLLNYPEWVKDGNPLKMKGEPIDYQWKKISQKKKDEKFKRAKYILLTGNKTFSPNNDTDIKAVKTDNKDGEKIKIIIGNSVTREGIDFKNIREIHIIDPWYHLYKIEQIIGRGIRYCSHNEHEELEKRNVTVYNHVAMLDDNIDSVDTDTYRMAEEKAEDIGKIEMIMKQNAIDAYLNKQVNLIENLKPINVTTSRGKNIENVNINDEPFTKICSFNDTCKINIYSLDKEKIKKLDILDESTLDKDTYLLHHFKDSIKFIKKFIISIFKTNKYHDEKDLIQLIKNNVDTSNIIILSALNSLINDKKIIFDDKKNPGRIIQKDNYYIFQPLNTDESIPIFYRNNGIDDKNNYKKEIVLNDMFELSPDELNEPIIADYRTIYEQIRKKYLKYREDYKELFGDGKGYLVNITIIIDHVVDSMTYDDKKVLLETIIQKNITKKPLDQLEEYILNETFIYNLIYKTKGGFTIDKKTKGSKLVGFFLQNTYKFFNNQNRQRTPTINDLDIFIFEKKWSPLDKIGLRKFNIELNNIKKNYEPVSLKPTYGYSFKDEYNKHYIKLVQQTSNMTNTPKTPGKIVGDAGQKILELNKILESNFNDYYKHLEIVNKDKKEFISLYMEFILRDNEQFMNYDIFPLKYYIQ